MESVFNLKQRVTFAPILYFNNLADAIEFTKKLLTQKNCGIAVMFTACHIAEMMIEDVLFICIKKYQEKKLLQLNFTFRYKEKGNANALPFNIR